MRESFILRQSSPARKSKRTDDTTDLQRGNCVFSGEKTYYTTEIGEEGEKGKTARYRKRMREKRQEEGDGVKGKRQILEIFLIRSDRGPFLLCIIMFGCLRL